MVFGLWQGLQKGRKDMETPKESKSCKQQNKQNKVEGLFILGIFRVAWEDLLRVLDSHTFSWLKNEMISNGLDPDPYAEGM